MNYRAWAIEPVDIKNASDKELLLNLVGWAILAPSAHNGQPWKFKVSLSHREISVYLSERGVSPISDPSLRQAYISIGCAVENMMFASEYYGLKTMTKFGRCSDIVEPVFQMTINERDPAKVEPHRAWRLAIMKRRRVNRGPYDPKRPILDGSLIGFKQAAKASGLRLDLVVDEERRAKIADLQAEADMAVINRYDFRRELTASILPNDSQSAVGMPGSTFGFTDEATLHIRDQLNKESLDPALVKNFSDNIRAVFCSAPLVGIISAAYDTRRQWIKAGRMLEGAILMAETSNLSASIHAGMVEVEACRQSLVKILACRRYPMAVFRMGYALSDNNSPHSPRLNAGEVTEVIE